MRRTGRIFWLLACGPSIFRTHLFPAFTAVRNTGILPVRQAEIFSAFLIQRSGTPLGAQTTSLCSAITTIGFVAAVYDRRREIVSSYSSATAPASHRISRADPLFQTRKELKRAIAACASPFKIYLVRRVFRAHFSSASN